MSCGAFRPPVALSSRATAFHARAEVAGTSRYKMTARSDCQIAFMSLCDSDSVVSSCQSFGLRTGCEFTRTKFSLPAGLEALAIRWQRERSLFRFRFPDLLTLRSLGSAPAVVSTRKSVEPLNVSPVPSVFAPGPELPFLKCRPATPVMESEIETGITPPNHPLVAEVGYKRYQKIVSYFADYPARSLMSDHNRAVLFALIGKFRPRAVAEIGTLYGGTAEVIARALWENGGGELHTADPFGEKRIPPILASWPAELRQRTHFYAMNSMQFLLELQQREIPVDMVLVDGNHDYEFALFDLQMAARLLAPGGIILMDNAEQTGPLRASLEFIRANPAWRELGSALASHDAANPFRGNRVSVPETSLIVLQAPTTLSISVGPVSSAQQSVSASRVCGFDLNLPAQKTSGVLHYQSIFRAFYGGGEVPEIKVIGHVDIDVDGSPLRIEHSFETPLEVNPGGRNTFEMELCWVSHSGAPFLALTSFPAPV